MKLRENTSKKEINKDCTLSMPDWSEYYDSVKHLLGLREVGFTRIFEHLKTIENPVIVETGTVRKENSFEGDGCSTVLFDHFVGTQGGTLISVDIDAAAFKIAADIQNYNNLFANEKESIDITFKNSIELNKISFSYKNRDKKIYLNEDKSNNMFINLHYGIRGVIEPQEVEVILQRVR